MGLISRVFGGPAATTALGSAARGLAEVFTANRTRKMELSHDAYIAALGEAGAEFAGPRCGWFDAFVNGLNRLPRPLLALGTLGLFVYAMVSPDSFSQRMVGLQQVPEPLWWLLGAIVSFYFGAREAHYFRLGGGTRPERGGTAAPVASTKAPSQNAALVDWQRGR